MSWYPDRKVLAGGVAGVITWGLTMALARYGIVLPPDLQSLIVGGVGWAIAYIVPPSTRDIIKRLDDNLVAMAVADPNIPVTPAKVKSLVVQQAGKVMTLALAVALIAPLAACGTTGSTTKSSIEAALEAGQSLTPEQKWEIACQSADAAHLVYIGFVAPKQSDAVNTQEAAAYEGIKALCATRPTNYASAVVALLSAVNAYKAAMPKVTKA